MNKLCIAILMDVASHIKRHFKTSVALKLNSDLNFTAKRVF